MDVNTWNLKHDLALIQNFPFQSSIYLIDFINPLKDIEDNWNMYFPLVDIFSGSTRKVIYINVNTETLNYGKFSVYTYDVLSHESKLYLNQFKFGDLIEEFDDNFI